MSVKEMSIKDQTYDVLRGFVPAKKLEPTKIIFPDGSYAEGYDPYSEVETYIEEYAELHKWPLEDYVVMIKVDPDKEGHTTTILEFNGCFDCWTHDWYEGEKEVKLIGFCPQSSAAETGWIMMNNKEGVYKPETDEED